MSVFEFLTIFLSFLLAISIGNMISHLGWLLIKREQVENSFLYLVSSFLLFTLQLQYWWATYKDAQSFDEELRFFLFFIYVVPMIFLVLTAYVLVSDFDTSQQRINLKEHYWERSRLVYAVGGLYLLSSLLADFAIVSSFPSRILSLYPLALIIRIVAIIWAFTLAKANRPNHISFHKVSLILLSLLLILYISLYSPRISEINIDENNGAQTTVDSSSIDENNSTRTTLDSLGSLGDFMSALISGIGLSAIYLQLRNLKLNQHASTIQGIASSERELWSLVMEGKDDKDNLINLSVAHLGISDEFLKERLAPLSKRDVLKLILFIRQYENIYFQHSNHMLPDGVWSHWQKSMNHTFSSDLVRAVYQEASINYNVSFKDFIENKIIGEENQEQDIRNRENTFSSEFLLLIRKYSRQWQSKLRTIFHDENVGVE